MPPVVLACGKHPLELGMLKGSVEREHLDYCNAHAVLHRVFPLRTVRIEQLGHSQHPRPFVDGA